MVSRIQDKMVELDGLAALRRKHQGRRIGICTGCFDVLQSGHAVFFEQCREHCEVLVVVVGRDASIRALKGPTRPINPERNRLYLVAALESVDYAILGDPTLKPGKIDCWEVAERLHPDIYILNTDDSGMREKQAFCERFGMMLTTVPRVVPDFLTPTSSTEIIDRVRDA